jgi:hypothetical protein
MYRIQESSNQVSFNKNVNRIWGERNTEWGSRSRRASSTVQTRQASYNSQKVVWIEKYNSAVVCISTSQERCRTTRPALERTASQIFPCQIRSDARHHKSHTCVTEEWKQGEDGKISAVRESWALETCTHLCVSSQSVIATGQWLWQVSDCDRSVIVTGQWVWQVSECDRSVIVAVSQVDCRCVNQSISVTVDQYDTMSLPEIVLSIKRNSCKCGRSNIDVRHR